MCFVHASVGCKDKFVDEIIKFSDEELESSSFWMDDIVRRNSRR